MGDGGLGMPESFIGRVIPMGSTMKGNNKGIGDMNRV